MRTRPPSPPLFPYTTLFRSIEERGPATRLGRRHGERVHQTGVRETHERCLPQESVVASTQGARQLAVHAHRPAPAELTDRKSTRLNSSHQINSYAVFCLKKK